MLIYGKYIFQRSANNNRQNSEEKLGAVNAITTKCLSQAYGVRMEQERLFRAS